MMLQVLAALGVEPAWMGTTAPLFGVRRVRCVWPAASTSSPASSSGRGWGGAAASERTAPPPGGPSCGCGGAPPTPARGATLPTPGPTLRASAYPPLFEALAGGGETMVPIPPCSCRLRRESVLRRLARLGRGLSGVLLHRPAASTGCVCQALTPPGGLGRSTRGGSSPLPSDTVCGAPG